MKFLLWDSDKAFNQGKKPDEIVLNYRTQVQPLGKKMGKAFCIHILTNGANEALWAKGKNLMSGRLFVYKLY
jgi:hypothetical protein